MIIEFYDNNDNNNNNNNSWMMRQYEWQWASDLASIYVSHTLVEAAPWSTLAVSIVLCVSMLRAELPDTML